MKPGVNDIISQVDHSEGIKQCIMISYTIMYDVKKYTPLIKYGALIYGKRLCWMVTMRLYISRQNTYIYKRTNVNMCKIVL